MFCPECGRKMRGDFDFKSNKMIFKCNYMNGCKKQVEIPINEPVPRPRLHYTTTVLYYNTILQQGGKE